MTEINLEKLELTGFLKRYGGLYEDSPWIAESAWQALANRNEKSVTPEALRSVLRGVVDDATREQKLALLKAHPELAGRAASDGKLTAESTEEQASARLDLCSKEEFELFQTLNTQYNQKFGFPFILAVRGRNREEILSAFQQRVNNSVPDEFDAAIEQVHQIAALRLDALEISGPV